jgi:hypothetical protein
MEVSEENRQQERLMFACFALFGMLASAPMTDRSRVNKRVWARQAYAWADVMLAVGKEPPNPEYVPPRASRTSR